MILSLFVQRGRYSKQPFRAKSNFRDIEFTKITEPHGEIGNECPPLQESFASGKAVDSFDSTNMVWTIQELEHVSDGDAESHEKLNLRTFRTCQYGDDNDLHYGCIKDKKLKPPTRKAFLRLLEVFGVDWHTSSTDNTQPDREPTLGDYVEFFKLFNKYDFKTEDGVKMFLKDFHFDDIFAFEDGKSVEL